MVLGTIELDVTIHFDLKRKETFKVVNSMNSVILLECSFLAHFETLEVNWRKMILRSDGKCIKGEEEFQGMALDASIHVAKGKVTDETIEQQLKSHAQDNTDL